MLLPLRLQGLQLLLVIPIATHCTRSYNPLCPFKTLGTCLDPPHSSHTHSRSFIPSLVPVRTPLVPVHISCTPLAPACAHSYHPCARSNPDTHLYSRTPPPSFAVEAVAAGAAVVHPCCCCCHCYLHPAIQPFIHPPPAIHCLLFVVCWSCPPAGSCSHAPPILPIACNVPLWIGDITLYIQIHIICNPAYNILLGWPFDILTKRIIRNFANEDPVYYYPPQVPMDSS